MHLPTCDGTIPIHRTPSMAPPNRHFGVSAMKCLMVAALCTITAPELRAEELKPWVVLVEGGTAEIHRSSSDGGAAGLWVGRALRQDHVRVLGGFWASSADESFVVIEVAGELRLCGVRCRVAPYIEAGVGYLGEPEFGGASFQVGGGIDVRIGTNNLLRASVRRGTHGGSSGPHALMVAFGHRFGSPPGGVPATR